MSQFIQQWIEEPSYVHACIQSPDQPACQGIRTNFPRQNISGWPRRQRRRNFVNSLLLIKHTISVQFTCFPRFLHGRRCGEMHQCSALNVAALAHCTCLWAPPINLRFPFGRDRSAKSRPIRDSWHLCSFVLHEAWFMGMIWCRVMGLMAVTSATCMKCVHACEEQLHFLDCKGSIKIYILCCCTFENAHSILPLSRCQYGGGPIILKF